MCLNLMVCCWRCRSSGWRGFWIGIDADIGEGLGIDQTGRFCDKWRNWSSKDQVSARVHHQWISLMKFTWFVDQFYRFFSQQYPTLTITHKGILSQNSRNLMHTLEYQPKEPFNGLSSQFCSWNNLRNTYLHREFLNYFSFLFVLLALCLSLYSLFSICFLSLLSLPLILGALFCCFSIEPCTCFRLFVILTHLLPFIFKQQMALCCFYTIPYLCCAKYWGGCSSFLFLANDE